MFTADRTEEQVLVMRAQRGEQEAFRVLLERYEKYVYTLALRMLSDPSDAEDVTQEVFLSAWRSLPNFRMEARFSTWLYRLTVNAATDLIRSRQREEGQVSMEEEPFSTVLSDDLPSPEEQVETKERKEVLNECIRGLTPEHRAILLLREVTGLSYEEIGTQLELSPGTVRSRLFRARLELRKKLQAAGNYFEEIPSEKRKRGEGR